MLIDLMNCWRNYRIGSMTSQKYSILFLLTKWLVETNIMTIRGGKTNEKGIFQRRKGWIFRSIFSK